MAGRARTNLFVAGIWSVSAGIADRRRIDAWKLPEGLFRAPKTPKRKQGTLQAVRKRRLNAMAIHKVRLGDLHGRFLVLLTAVRLQLWRQLQSQATLLSLWTELPPPTICADP
jgi:hypothetical protein